MNIYYKSIFLSVLLAAVVVSGCADKPLAPEQEDVITLGVHEFTPEGTTSNFTGRDSLFGTMMFGVNFTARVSGEWSENGRCKELEGSGSATHLGRITVEQEICVNGDEIIEGNFRLNGRRNFVEGEYRHLPDPPTLIGESLSAGLEITDTNIRPTQIDDIDDHWTGWGWMNGELHENGTFSYKIDGWLHHKQVEVPGLKDRF